MAKFSRIEVIDLMETTGLVPLFYHPDTALGKKVLAACYRGGARLLEFTARGDFAHEVFGELRKFAAAELPGLAMGVGSVTDAPAASLYMQLGADFVVTPSFREDIARICNRRKVLWSPGCGTLTEINQAEELGCELIKLFPGSVYGPEFVKAVRGPQPWTRIMPTGGVSTDAANLASWFSAGVTCVGMGSGLISSQVLKQQDFNTLEQTVAGVLDTIRSVRNPGA
ncbi:bifunctional 4-hydroxy-2-oxoglutarate aldolase/2-dehydro-3-deoxy-phosphogluconate aldolase [Robiginitalea sp. SC105]|uniref:bifunctional 4-hydroxy-2-oxoglutarate aldolase/2-dehydro-3-deoxy-phosphogluconate aldolase n=1 Tax=Robiginitalea sp. SC105 TaxID=2762332 RepID=UPI00163963DA|nr:bifunctional 4-hydroxy-2-oxoglutarate aldolase/2-dehydro-3-deoxy-phosphogluconate aldolase [Robiginitalea sp. SC105]MBC2838699.1 bifunctional 4-hydroxy-2-oxoglutarate aldolase/2-dehydro-3-deoxy-phosphogluconate aldolase [Robiginitalea sp. SC105]